MLEGRIEPVHYLCVLVHMHVPVHVLGWGEEEDGGVIERYIGALVRKYESCFWNFWYHYQRSIFIQQC